jgi:hypothetical protein
MLLNLFMVGGYRVYGLTGSFVVAWWHRPRRWVSPDPVEGGGLVRVEVLPGRR